jgi:hypothetical protein
MNPGYDRPDHKDFRRKIGYDCTFCHNGYRRSRRYRQTLKEIMFVNSYVKSKEFLSFG